jgi:heme/copper-type cytochrome/quinol oxidase subunit 1
MARVQPWLWFLGMLLFSIPTHLTGLMGMPRRVFDPSCAGHPAAASWQWLTDVPAVAGMVLFASSLFFLLVMLFTLFGPRVANEPMKFAEAARERSSRVAPLVVRSSLVSGSSLLAVSSFDVRSRRLAADNARLSQPLADGS